MGSSIRTEFDLFIFDCDGVLVDSEVLSCQCLADVLGWHGVTIGLDEVFERFLGRASSAVAEYFLTQTGRPLPNEFRRQLRAHLAAVFERSLKLMPGVPAVLETIEKPYCLATSSDVDRIEMTLRVARIREYFGERVYSAAMVPNGKPAPDLFLHAASAMKADPRRTLVIEDSANGVLAGKRAGMTVWGFIGGSHYRNRDGRQLLGAAGADRIFGSMSELMSA